MNSLFIPCNRTMQKRLPFVPSEQNVTCFCVFPFAPCSTHVVTYLVVLWIFPISRSRLKKVYWLPPNCTASCFCVCESSSSNNACNSTSSIFLAVFHVFWLPSCLVSKSPLFKRRNHRSHVFCVGASSPWASRSNRYDSSTVWTVCSSRMLFVRYKFQHIEHNNTSPRIHFPNLSLVRVWRLLKTTKWRSVKSLQHKLLRCAICCLKSSFRTCTPGIRAFETQASNCIVIKVIEGYLPNRLDVWRYLVKVDDFNWWWPMVSKFACTHGVILLLAEQFRTRTDRELNWNE